MPIARPEENELTEGTHAPVERMGIPIVDAVKTNIWGPEGPNHDTKTNDN